MNEHVSVSCLFVVGLYISAIGPFYPMGLFRRISKDISGIHVKTCTYNCINISGDNSEARLYLPKAKQLDQTARKS